MDSLRRLSNSRDRPLTATVDQELIDQVLTLHQHQFSKRAISRTTGLSRWVVSRILLDHQQIDFAQAVKGTDPPFSGPPRRCPTCGGMVRHPCLACRIRGNALTILLVLLPLGWLFIFSSALASVYRTANFLSETSGAKV